MTSSKTDYTYANCGTDGYFTPGCAYAEFDKALELLHSATRDSSPKELMA